MKYYAVKNGRKPGIYESWDECRRQVTGYSGAEYKSFPTRAAAKEFIGAGTEQNVGAVGVRAYVDGSYNIKTGAFGFGAVILSDGAEQTFCEGFCDAELAAMHNVAGELKGAEFVMRYCRDNGIPGIEIYYDYEGIAAWAEGRWKTNKDGTRAYKAFYDEIKKDVAVRFVKVKGHSGDKYNDMADKLAKKASGVE